VFRIVTSSAQCVLVAQTVIILAFASEETIVEEGRQETGFLPAKNDLALRADSHAGRPLFGFAL